VYWIVATSVTGNRLGAVCLPDLPPIEDPCSHDLALTTEFQQLLRTCWPDSQWVLVNSHKYVVFRADAGVLGTLVLDSSVAVYAS